MVFAPCLLAGNSLGPTFGPNTSLCPLPTAISWKEQPMKTRIAMSCLAAVACLALGLTLTRTNQAAPEDKPIKANGDKAMAEEEAAILKAVALYTAAFAKGDTDAVLAMWTADAEFIDDNGKVYRGHDALAPLFTKNLPSYKGYKITGKLTSVRFVKPDVALVDGEQTFTPPRGEPDVSRFTSVWVKVDGQWRIRSARDLTPEPAGETVPGRRLRELDWLVGDWVNPGKDSSVHLKVTWGLNKAFLILEYEVKHKHGATSKVAQWMGWDPATEQIKSWVFDDQGGYGEGLWRRNGNTWTSDWTGVLPDGSTGSAVNILKYEDDNTFVWQSVRREADRQPLPDVDAKFVRQSANP
jgi:uncharacterized protein (TIGR02246 family)